MGKYKICVYAICKNEEKFVDKWVKSMSEADLIVVTDTGSTDGTVEKLKNHGVIVYEEKIVPWRFDVARNVSLSHVPEDVDICVCTDLDELLNEGWRDALEKAWEKTEALGDSVIRTGRYIYNWSLKPDGTPDVQFHYFKVHERFGFEWKCPVHEFLAYIGTKPLEKIFIEGMVLNHYPDKTKSRSSYLGLLETAVKEDPNDCRMRYYLGREYMYAARWEDCIRTLVEYLNMPNSYWNDERCAAMRWIAKSYRNLGKINDAYIWYYRAIAEQPKMREPYIEFAQLCNSRGDFCLSYYLVKEAFKIKERSKTFVNMGYAWDHTPYDLLAVCAYYLGLYDESYESAKKAVELNTNDERLQMNLKLIESKVKNKSA